MLSCDRAVALLPLPAPFLLALLAWETVRRPGRAPVLALGATAATWASFEWLPAVLTPDALALAYLGWMLPLGAVLLRASLRLGAAAAREQAWSAPTGSRLSATPAGR